MSTPSIRFVGGDAEHGEVFVVETKAPAGYELGSHTHEHAHTSVLVSGVADVTVAGVTRRMRGYELVTIPAGSTHTVVAITDIVWLCLWAGDLAPRKEVEESLQLTAGRTAHRPKRGDCYGCPGMEHSACCAHKRPQDKGVGIDGFCHACPGVNDPICCHVGRPA